MPVPARRFLLVLCAALAGVTSLWAQNGGLARFAESEEIPLVGQTFSHPQISVRVDDADRVLSLGGDIELGRRMGIVRIESVEVDGTWIGTGRVTMPLNGLLFNERLVFVRAAISPGFRPQSFLVTEGHIPWSHAPPMHEGEDYLVIFADFGSYLEAQVRSTGRKEPVVDLASCKMISVTQRDINAILPDLRSLVEASKRPAQERPAALRAWLFPRLETNHKFLRFLIFNEAAHNETLYSGMTTSEAARLANFSDGGAGLRFSVLRNLAKLTPHPMDSWYLRAVSQGAPNRIDPDDTTAVAAFDDSLYAAAPRLSIDSFWPILERRTRAMSLWVRAFAQKRDPRLLPIILRHLDPANLDLAAANALSNYRGMPAAEDAVVQAAADRRVRGDKRARALARESLRQIGTPRAQAVAAELADDDEK